MNFLLGQPHSLQRYVVFGAIAGFMAFAFSRVFHVSLAVAQFIACVVAGWTAGMGTPGAEVPAPEDNHPPAPAAFG
ncbi:MAG TPA: hypothetical protein VMB21_19105 [Candidatus Limnocylindria bacterium]|jgi:hypothetical protein|nr:hypothetical protein [Candidatus Limnocylindria bacterium]HTL69282.1 hypothetical protein [Lacunisphaera sp.]